MCSLIQPCWTIYPSFQSFKPHYFHVQAIANLSVNANVAKSVADEGGITILANLARSMNRLVAEEAAGGLWNLSVGEEHKVVYSSLCSSRACSH